MIRALELKNKEGFEVKAAENGETIQCVGFRKSILSYLYLLYSFGSLSVSLIILVFIGSSITKNATKFFSTEILSTPIPYITLLFLTLLCTIAIISFLQFYVLVRPFKPPFLTLTKTHLFYDNGSLPWILITGLNDKTALSFGEIRHRLKTFTQRSSQFDLAAIKTIRLQVMHTPKRLIIKQGTKEVELVRHFDETDKVRLLRHIKSYYNLNDPEE